MAAVRLRKAFHYPEDSDNENERDELDEEEQERVIEQLQRQNDARNAQYNVNKTELTRGSLPRPFLSFQVVDSFFHSVHLLTYFVRWYLPGSL